MDNAFRTFGRVVGYDGTSPGPASGITYQVRVNTATGPIVFDGIKPCGWRWEDVDVDAAKLVDTEVDIVIVAGKVYGLFVEAPHIVECGSE